MPPSSRGCTREDSVGFRIVDVIEALTEVQAAPMFGTDQPRVSDIVRGSLQQFPADCLMRFITVRGSDVEIAVRPDQRAPGAGHLRVFGGGRRESATRPRDLATTQTSSNVIPNVRLGASGRLPERPRRVRRGIGKTPVVTVKSPGQASQARGRGFESRPPLSRRQRKRPFALVSTDVERLEGGAPRHAGRPAERRRLSGAEVHLPQ
jgi:predicted XRE-type DNA-binding protein